MNMTATPDALETILFARRQRLDAARAQRPLSELEKGLKHAPPPRDFFGRLVKRGTLGLIAEMKRKSPSAGDIRSPYDVAAIAAAYEKGGADALSVLTEQDAFGGSIEDVERARAASTLPILRKDFVFDPYQVMEARAFGADAVLLIADMIPANDLASLVRDAQQIGLEPLVEVFTEESVGPAVDSGALEDSGFIHYETSAFAKPAMQCRHNLN